MIRLLTLVLSTIACGPLVFAASTAATPAQTATGTPVCCGMAPSAPDDTRTGKPAANAAQGEVVAIVTRKNTAQGVVFSISAPQSATGVAAVASKNTDPGAMLPLSAPPEAAPAGAVAPKNAPQGRAPAISAPKGVWRSAEGGTWQSAPDSGSVPQGMPPAAVSAKDKAAKSDDAK